MKKVALVGRTNVGKSTLFNRIVGTRRSIDFDEENITRDVIEYAINDDLTLIDTPGFDYKDDELVKSGVEALEKTLSEVDYVLFVVDGSAPLVDLDKLLIKKVFKAGVPLELVVNMSDRLAPGIKFNSLGVKEISYCSALHNEGVDDIIYNVSKKLEVSFRPQKDLKPSFVFIGRPNVGKSSLFNAISEKDISLVSDIAMTTRDSIWTDLTIDDEEFKAIDTAGVRKPGKISKGIEYLSVNRTKAALEEADLAILVLDPSLGHIAHQDLALAGLINDHAKALIIVVNKTDKVSGLDLKHFRKMMEVKLQFCWWAPIVEASALEAINIDKLADLISLTKKSLKVEANEKQITSIIKTAFIENKAPKTRKIKIYHRPHFNNARVISDHPLKIEIFGRDLNTLHFSYTRYLTNRLRQELDLGPRNIQLVYSKNNIN